MAEIAARVVVIDHGIGWCSFGQTAQPEVRPGDPGGRADRLVRRDPCGGEGMDLVGDPAAGPRVGPGQDGHACFGGRGGELAMHRSAGQVPVLARAVGALAHARPAAAGGCAGMLGSTLWRGREAEGSPV